MANAALDPVWPFLQTVTTVRFTSHSAQQDGWQGTGLGSVQVQMLTDDSLIFWETGHWYPQRGGRVTRFHNAFRWTRLTPERIRLEHGRFGWEQPVILFDLVPQSAHLWVSLAPHVCGNDTYTATVSPRHDEWAMRWQILGPRKQAQLRYAYRH
ncbi:MAG: DUF6314 family protein [Synechococcales cyanobacterium]